MDVPRDPRPDGHRSRSLRSQVLVSTLGVAFLAVALFAIPLAWIVPRYLHDQSIETLQAEAAHMIATLPAQLPGEPAFDPPRDSDVVLARYRPDGTLRDGDGPAISTEAARAFRDGEAVVVEEGDALAVFEPFGTATDGTVVRAAMPLDAERARTRIAWLVLGALSLLVLALAGLVAVLRARALSRPFEQLAAAARDLGEGAFALTVPETGIAEAEDVARALEVSAARIGDRVTREQQFAEDASHQLRTPLTAARLTLESALADPDGDYRAAAATALGQVDRLQGTIDDLLALTAATRGPGDACDLAAELADLRRRWVPVASRLGRDVRVQQEPSLPVAAASSAAVRQVLDVLVDNALRHGRGDVLVRARDLAGSVAVDVESGGRIDPAVVPVVFERGASAAGGTGIGLALARELTEAVGGRLSLTRPGDPTTFTLVLQAGPETSPGAAVHSAPADHVPPHRLEDGALT